MCPSCRDPARALGRQRPARVPAETDRRRRRGLGEEAPRADPDRASSHSERGSHAQAVQRPPRTGGGSSSARRAERLSIPGEVNRYARRPGGRCRAGPRRMAASRQPGRRLPRRWIRRRGDRGERPEAARLPWPVWDADPRRRSRRLRAEALAEPYGQVGAPAVSHHPAGGRCLHRVRPPGVSRADPSRTSCPEV